MIAEIRAESASPTLEKSPSRVERDTALRFTGSELIKIARLPLIWAIVAICVMINMLMAIAVPANTVALYNYASAVSVSLGGKVGPDFDRKLAQASTRAASTDARVNVHTTTSARTDTRSRTHNVEVKTASNTIIDPRIPAGSTITADELHRQLVAITRGATNTLADYDATAMQNVMLAQVNGDPVATWLLQHKYNAYATRVAHLTKTQASMDLAAGSATYTTLTHWMNTTSYVLFETCMLAVLLMALALGYERTSGTAQLLMVTRVGRQLTIAKMVAGLIASASVYLLLVSAFLIPYLAVFDVRGVWSASISSQFNTVFGQRPFITWWDMTIGQYLFMRLALGLLLTLCFALFTSALELLIHHTFAVVGCVGVTVILIVGVVSAAHAFNLPWLAWISGFNPVGVLLLRNQWFTELGLDAPIPFWETSVTLCSLVYLTIAVVLAQHMFTRQDLLR